MVDFFSSFFLSQVIYKNRCFAIQEKSATIHKGTKNEAIQMEQLIS